MVEQGAVLWERRLVEAQVDHFRVMRLLGEGSHGAVYLARDTKLGRKVALKVIKPGALSERARGRFLEEARTTARFSHPHIVTIYEVGEHRGAPYVALEHLDGQTLRQRLREEPPGPKEALRLTLAIARALAEAHRRKILHRDLKPENVIIPQDGRLRVVDFGLATPLDDPRGQGKAAALAGTPAYMAPEQWKAEPNAEATDVWALGVICYELLTGKRPFDAPSAQALAELVIGTGAPPPWPQLQAPQLQALLEKTLSRPQAYRPSAQMLVEALEQVLSPGRKTESDASPFRGLLPFAERHAEQFYGREAEVAAFVEQIRDTPMMPVVGPSGAGKSSFVQAGVLPLLRERGRWIVLRMRPGAQPVRTLAQRCASGEEQQSTRSPRSATPGSAELGAWPAVGAEKGSESPEEIERALREQPERLSLYLQRLAHRTGAKVLLFVDQLEEVYTLVEEESRREVFMEALVRAADDPQEPIRVIVTLRDDYLGRLASTSAARKALSFATVLRAPGPRAMSQIIWGPLRATGYTFDDAQLPQRMIAEVEKSAAALPLLQFVLTAMWERKDTARRVLLRESYEALGGVAGALATHADSTYSTLSATEAKAARSLLLRMVTSQRTRQRARADALLEGMDESATSALDRLVKARLVIARKGEAPTYEIAHESMLTAWTRLSRWLDESAEELVFVRELSEAARLWEKRGKRPEELWSGEALLEAQIKLGRLRIEPPKQASRFIEAAVQRAAAKGRRRRWVTAAGFVAVASLALVFFGQKQQAQRLRRRADVALAASMLEGAQSDLQKGAVWDARAKLRASLEVTDSLAARALWVQLNERDLIWKKKIPGASDLVFTADGGEIITQSVGGNLTRIDPSTFETSTVALASKDVYRLAGSPSGAWLAASDELGRVRLLKRAEGRITEKRVLEGHTQPVWGMSFDPEERVLATASWDHSIRVWEVATGKLLKTLRGHQDRVYAVVFLDGERLVSSGWDRSVLLWRWRAGRSEVLWEHSEKVVALAHEQGRLAASTEDGLVAMLSLKGADATVLSGHRSRVSALAFLPGEPYLVTASWDRTLRLWSTQSGAPIRELGAHESYLNQVAVSPDGRRIAVVNQTGEVQVLRARPKKVPDPPKPGVLPSLALAPGGAVLATTAEPHAVALRDPKDGRFLQVLKGHRNVIRPLAFSPDGAQLASAGFDAVVRLWNVRTGAEEGTLRGHRGPITSLRYRPDGTLISVGLSANVLLWSRDRGLKRTLSYPERLSEALSDDVHLVLGSFTGRIYVRRWDALGRPPKVLLCKRGAIVHNLKFTRDKARDVLAVCGNGLYRISLSTGEVRTLLESKRVEQPACLIAPPQGGLIHSVGGRLVHDGPRGTVELFPKHSDACALTPDGQALLFLGPQGTLRRHRLSDGAQLWGGARGAPVAPAPKVRAPSSSAKVSQRLRASERVLIVGREDGALEVHDQEGGDRLMELQLHGPIRILKLDGGRLRARSEVGFEREVDLSPLFVERGALMRIVRARAPAVWRAGRAERSPP